MEIENIRIINSKYKKKKISFFKKISKKKLICYLFIIIIFYFYNDFKNRQQKKIINNIILTMKNMLIENKIKFNQNYVSIKNKEINIYNETNIFQEDITEQNKFCNNKNLYFNSIFDESIRLTNVKFYNKEFKMYVYKKNDVVSNNILRTKTWESLTTKNILSALFYYSKKYNLSNNDSYIIDIGANVGWFLFF